MNRILQAEVILTLTVEQAHELLQAAFDAPSLTTPLYEVLREQCAKQGVQL